MGYIDDIFTRLDIQRIREFLMSGSECVETERGSYKERLDEAEKAAMDIIEKKFPDVGEHEEIVDKVCVYASTAKEVFMEIGMKCGAVLIAQLLGDGSGGLIPKLDFHEDARQGKRNN